MNRKMLNLLHPNAYGAAKYRFDVIARAKNYEGRDSYEGEKALRVIECRI